MTHCTTMDTAEVNQTLPAIPCVRDVVAAELRLAGQRIANADALCCDDPPQATCYLQQALPGGAPGDRTPELPACLWKADHRPSVYT